MSATDSFALGIEKTLDVLASTITVASSTVETDILNVTVPAGRLGPNGRLRFLSAAVPQNKSGAAQTVIYSIYATPTGGSEMTVGQLQVSVDDMPIGNTFGRGLFEAEVVNIATEGGQFLVMKYREAIVSTLSFTTSDRQQEVGAGSAAHSFDSTLDTAIRLAVQLGAADSQYSVKVGPAYLNAVYIA